MFGLILLLLIFTLIVFILDISTSSVKTRAEYLIEGLCDYTLLC